MKTRTRVVATVYIVVCSAGALAGLMQTVALTWYQRELAVVTFSLALLLVNTALLLCWIALLKGRAWAWTTLIVLLGLCLLPVVVLALSMTVGMLTGPWQVLLILTASGWIGIPALVFLLLDKPSTWSTANSVHSRDADKRKIKKRTHVVAWVFAIYSSYVSLVCIAVIPGTVFHTHRVPWWLIREAIPGGIVCAAWIGLLKGRAVAWWTLVTVNSVSIPWGIWNTVRIPAYYAAHHKPLTHLGGVIAFNSVWIGLGCLLPLIFLLTDRPSGWANPKPRTLNAEP